MTYYHFYKNTVLWEDVFFLNIDNNIINLHTSALVWQVPTTSLHRNHRNVEICRNEQTVDVAWSVNLPLLFVLQQKTRNKIDKYK